MNDGCGEYFDKENGEVQARFCIKFQGQTDSCRTDGCDYTDLNEKGRKWTCICTKTDLCNNYNSTSELPPDLVPVISIPINQAETSATFKTNIIAEILHK